MVSLQNKLRQIGRAFNNALPGIVFHYHRPPANVFDGSAWLVWAEDFEENSFHGDNKKHEQVLHVSADYYTKTNYDANLDVVQDVLNDVLNVPWYIEAVQYEEDTELIHYTFSFEVVNNGEI